MNDVTHVLPVTLVDEQPVPEKLLGRGDAHWRRGEDGRPAVLVPSRVDQGQAVSHAEDEIDEEVAVARLREPVRLLELHRESSLPQRTSSLDGAFGLDEHIEVFRLPINPRVLVDRVRSSDDVGDAVLVERS